jgi:hypothetical protein
MLALLLLPIVVAPSPPPAPSVVMSIAQESERRWRMRVENTGTVPVKLAADARLLVLDVTAPGVEKPVRCELPVDMRPGPDDNALVLPPQRAYAELLDPRLYCFGAKEAAALVPGATVVAHLGWPTPPRARKLTAPFVVEPIEGVSPPVAAAKEIAAPALTIVSVTSSTTAQSPLAPPSPDEQPDADAPRIEVLASPREDAYDARDAAIIVTVLNQGDKATPVLVRPETLSFEVTAPDGTVQRCGSLRPVDSPIRELFNRIPAHGRTTLRLLIGDSCPDRAFDQPGLYTVRPELDTRRASGRSINLRTFDGLAAAPVPTRLRIRHTRKQAPPRRPALE